MLFHLHNLNGLGDYCRPMKRIVFLIFVLVPVCLSAAPTVPVLISDTDIATAGYYQLSWQTGRGGASQAVFHFELQQAADDRFESARTIYRGTDHARVISGQRNGDYFYRLRITDPGQDVDVWSETVHVRVQHHSQQRAWLFFIAGAAVFLATLLFIIVHARREPET